MLIDPKIYEKYIKPQWRDEFVLWCYGSLDRGIHYRLASKKYDWGFFFDVPAMHPVPRSMDIETLIHWFMKDAMEQFERFLHNLEEGKYDE